MRLTKLNEHASARDDEASGVSEEFKVFKKYQPAFIWRLFTMDKINRFKELAAKENMTYIETKRDDYHTFIRTDGYDLR